METEVSKEKICVNKLISKESKTITVHNDVIVPDAKPDVLNIINTNGTIGIYKKDISEGKIQMDGSIDTFVMYLPDSKESILRAINFNLDFSEKIQIEDLEEGMQVEVQTVLKQIDSKVINGRKINVKAVIEFEIKVYSNEEIEVVKNINNIDNIQVLQKEYDVDCLVGTGRTIVYAKDTFNVDNKDEIAEILKVEIKFLDKDLKVSYNKVLAKSDVEIKLLYLTEENDVKSITGKIPAVGFIDIQNVAENNIFDVRYDINNILIKPNSIDEHSIYVELEIEVNVSAYESRKINLIQDLYSPTCNVQYQQKMVTLLSGRNEQNKEININEKISLPEIKDNENILDADVKATIKNTQITNTKIMYTGEITLNFIIKNENSINSKVVKLPFEGSVDNLAGTTKVDVENEISIENTIFEVKREGEINAEINLKVRTKISKNIMIKLIENIECVKDENKEEDYNSLIIYIVREGDSLWEISKKFNSTIEEIARMNGIENKNKISVGQKLYIPKFNYSKKELVNE